MTKDSFVSYYLEYKRWCREQVTNRYPRRYETIKEDEDKVSLCLRVLEWEEEHAMMPTLDGFVEYLDTHTNGEYL